MEHRLAPERGVRLQGLGDGPLVSVWDARRTAALPPQERVALHAILAEFGARSAAAQGLPSPITDLPRLESAGSCLYLAAQRQSTTSLLLFGGLKVGAKQLFVWAPGERRQRQVATVAVLDFYVCEPVQRCGVGRQLFDAFLQAEGLSAGQVAYDLPSPKLLAFLAKHYGLRDPVTLPSNYVVFPQFLDGPAYSPAYSPGASAPGGAATGRRQQQRRQQEPLRQQQRDRGCWESVAARPLTAHGRRAGRLPPARLPPSHSSAGAGTTALGRPRASVPSCAAPWATSLDDGAAREGASAPSPCRTSLPSLRAPPSASPGSMRQSRQLAALGACSTGRPASSCSPHGEDWPARGAAAVAAAAGASPARARALAQRQGSSMRDCLSW